MLASKNEIVKERVIKRFREWRDKQPENISAFSFREDVRFIIDLAIEEEIKFIEENLKEMFKPEEVAVPPSPKGEGIPA